MPVPVCALRQVRQKLVPQAAPWKAILLDAYSIPLFPRERHQAVLVIVCCATGLLESQHATFFVLTGPEKSRVSWAHPHSEVSKTKASPSGSPLKIQNVGDMLHSFFLSHQKRLLSCISLCPLWCGTPGALTCFSALYSEQHLNI